MLTGGLLPFPRTGCVLYAKAILSYCSEIQQVSTASDGHGVVRTAVAAPAFNYFRRLRLEMKVWWAKSVQS